MSEREEKFEKMLTAEYYNGKYNELLNDGLEPFEQLFEEGEDD